MKKTVMGSVALLLAACLVGCGGGNNDDRTTKGANAFDPAWEITVCSREEGSGTRGAFIELFGVEQKNEAGEKVDQTTAEANITNSTAVMMTTVSSNQYAIGYISLGSLSDTVKALQIDGVAPSVAAVKSGEYKIARPFSIATKGTVSDVAQDFIDYIMSAEGQAVVEANGYIPVDGTPAYAGKEVSGKVVVAGSSSVSPVMEKLKEAYLAVNTNATIEIQTSDSTTGMTALQDGICDIGMASRALKESETAAGLKATVIAMDGIVVIVNKSNPATNMTSEMVRDIFTGKYLTWDELPA